jgi:hypothetical protein
VKKLQLFLELEVFDTIIKDEDIKKVRNVFGKQMETIIASGKMVANGFFAGKRGGYIILNVDNTEEVVELLGTMIEFFHFKVHPVMPLEKVPELFGKYLAL